MLETRGRLLYLVIGQILFRNGTAGQILLTQLPSSQRPLYILCRRLTILVVPGQNNEKNVIICMG
jgi:hypothetical protein